MADVEAIEAELGQLKKRKLELTREIQREKDKKAKKGKSLATLLCELGADPMVDQPGSCWLQSSCVTKTRTCF